MNGFRLAQGGWGKSYCPTAQQNYASRGWMLKGETDIYDIAYRLSLNGAATSIIFVVTKVLS